MAGKKWTPPDYISVGAGVRMISLEGVGKSFGGAPSEAVLRLLDTLGVPRVRYPGLEGKSYVNLYALESCLFPLGLPKQFANGPNNRNGKSDPELIRLHQELAGVLYNTWTKEAVRQRVKKLAREMCRLPGSDKISLTGQPESGRIQAEETVYVPIKRPS